MVKEVIEASMGDIVLDTVIKNGQIVDVFSKNIIRGDIGIYKGKIVGIGIYKGKVEIDAKGAFITPGLIDSHVHIESSMVIPKLYSKIVMPHGVTSIIADPHEIANVCGVNGIVYMIENSSDIPLSVHYMVPSCVPATNFESSGAVLHAADLKELISQKEVLGLGEMMNYVGVIEGDKEVLDKIELFKDSVIDGHAPGLTGNKLNAYAYYVKTDHECSTVEEMEEKISKGMYINIREGTLAKNLETLISGVNKNNLSRCMFCSDDRNIGDIVNEGTVDYAIKKAISLGFDSIDAITMGTINVANCYGLKNYGAIAPGYFADLVITKDLAFNEILSVFKQGELISQNGKYLKEIETVKNESVYKTVKIKNLKEDDFKIKLSSNRVNVIKIQPNLIENKREVEEVIVENGLFVQGKNTELSKIAVIERHGKNGNIGKALVKNFNIKNGAIASTIGHDSHNMIVIGDNDLDMLNAVNALNNEGGIAISVNGSVEHVLNLPVAGLMSDNNYEEVLVSHEKLYSYIELLKINSEIDPFMTLAFLPLPVIEEVRITDKGLFDVTKFKFISLEE